MTFRVVIDPGHILCRPDGTYPMQGKQSPKVPPGIYEGEFNRRVALIVQDILRTHGATVVLTTPEIAEENVSLESRVDLAEDIDADYFVSIQANAHAKPGWSKPHGYVLFASSGGKQLARDIVKSFRDNLPQSLARYRGVPQPAGGYFVLRKQNHRSAVLIECGFMTNKVESIFMSSAKGQEQYGVAIAEGIIINAERG
jgi:N-acetylmuramoyl-L-alanine amidase